MKKKILFIAIFIILLLAVLIGIFYKDIDSDKKKVELQIEKLQASYSNRIYKVSDLINLVVDNVGDNEQLAKVASSRDSINKAITADNIKLMHKRNNNFSNDINNLFESLSDNDINNNEKYNELKQSIIKKLEKIESQEKKYNKIAKKYNKKLDEFPMTLFKLKKFKIINN